MIREAVRADLVALVDAIVALNENGTAADPRYRLHEDGPARLREHLLHAWFGRFLPFPACLVAESEGRIVGLVSGELAPDPGILANPPTARIDNLWVEPDHRRTGIARRLVEAWCARAVRAGYPRTTVGTLVRDARAVAFWEAMGFEALTVTLARS
jgi:GNAT superfamily N-acetyltransferase